MSISKNIRSREGHSGGGTSMQSESICVNLAAHGKSMGQVVAYYKSLQEDDFELAFRCFMKSSNSRDNSLRSLKLWRSKFQGTTKEAIANGQIAKFVEENSHLFRRKNAKN